MAERGLTRAAGWAALAASASFFLLPAMNPDLFWHLSAGKYILSHGAVPRADWLSWPEYGRPWVDFEWGAQAAYFLLYKLGGLRALWLFKAALLTGLLLVFRRLVLLYGRGDLLPAALPLLAAALVSSSDVRPENFSLLFFTAELYLLERLRLGVAREGLGLYAGVFALFGLWVNLHAGVFYGLALAGLYAAGALLHARLPAGAGLAGGCCRAGVFGGFFAAGLAASFANPYGWRVYEVGLAHAGQAADLAAYIQEWGAFTLANRYQWPFVLLLAAGGLALARAALRGRAVYPHLLAFLFFAWSAGNHARHIPYFALTALAFALAQPGGGFSPGAWPRRALWSLWAAACCWFWAALVLPNYSRAAGGFTSVSPDLARFLKAEAPALAPLKMYNYWGWGGWLGWELAPEYKVYVDGRYLFHGYLPEMVEARTSAQKWRDLIARRGFDLMLIQLDEPPAPVKQRLTGGEEVFWRPAYLFYLPKAEWAVTYWDAKIAAVVRRSVAPAGWLAGREFRWLRPGDMHNLRLPVLRGDVALGELEADARLYAAQHPGDGAAGEFVAKLAALCAAKGAKCRK